MIEKSLEETRSRVQNAIPAYVFFKNIDSYLNTNAALPDTHKLGCDRLEDCYDLVFNTFQYIVKEYLRDEPCSMRMISRYIGRLPFIHPGELSVKDIAIRVVIEIIMNGSEPMMPYHDMVVNFIRSEKADDNLNVYKPTEMGMRFYFSTKEYEAYLENLNGLRFDLILIQEKLAAGDYEQAANNAQRIYASLVHEHETLIEMQNSIAADPLKADLNEFIKNRDSISDALNHAKEVLNQIMKSLEIKLKEMMESDNDRNFTMYGAQISEVNDWISRSYNKDLQIIEMYTGMTLYWQEQVKKALTASTQERFLASQITDTLKKKEATPSHLDDFLQQLFVRPLPKTFSIHRLDETKQEYEDIQDDGTIDLNLLADDAQKKHYGFKEMAPEMMKWIKENLEQHKSIRMSKMSDLPQSIMEADDDMKGALFTSIMIQIYQSFNGETQKDEPIVQVARAVECPAFTVEVVEGTCMTIDGELDHDLLFERYNK